MIFFEDELFSGGVLTPVLSETIKFSRGGGSIYKNAAF